MDRTFTYDEVTEAYAQAGHWWRSLVGGIEDHQWDQGALGEWTVRELVAHGARAFRTVPEYVDGEVKDPTTIESAAEYFRIVLAEQTPHVHIANRARAEARELDDWVAATDQAVAAADLVACQASGSTVAHLFVGEMTLDQYLATRVVEVVVHGTDLGQAIGIPSPPPPGAAKVAISVLLDLSTGDDLATIARMLTGRRGNPPLANVLA
jgi:uncharacterized protein (TIGR03083 family)